MAKREWMLWVITYKMSLICLNFFHFTFQYSQKLGTDEAVEALGTWSSAHGQAFISRAALEARSPAV